MRNMETNGYATGEPVVFSSEIAEELNVQTYDEIKESEVAAASDLEDPDVLNGAETLESTEQESVVIMPEIEFPEDLLTNETYLNGIGSLVNKIDPDSVNEEVLYVDRGSLYTLGSDLPDFACVYLCNDIEVVFPTDYAEDILVNSGMLINLGSNYTAGLVIDGYEVSNYLSSEITIPTYHSATWYQYLQTYGQPYRIVDRYVNNYGSISSSTRSDVYVEWSGGNPWQGFTFERIALFMIVAILGIMFLFRKGR